jgi:glucosamine--fructose-6-phosphate aminotransferase (isomerizing)
MLLLVFRRGYNFQCSWRCFKTKEISYIHAEGYPGWNETRPIALIDEQMPVVVIAPNKGIMIR